MILHVQTAIPQNLILYYDGLQELDCVVLHQIVHVFIDYHH